MTLYYCELFLTLTQGQEKITHSSFLTVLLIEDYHLILNIVLEENNPLVFLISTLNKNVKSLQKITHLKN